MLLVGIIYLAEMVYAFTKPKASYEIFSFDVPFYAFAIYKLFLGTAFIMLFRQRVNNED
jgi:hypothetical protein